MMITSVKMKNEPHLNERKVMIMKTVIIEYSVVSPAVLAYIVEKAFNCLCVWHDLGEDAFEFSIYKCADLAMLEDFLAEYM